MRESIGNTFLFNIIIVVIGVIMVLLISSIAYSKAFKVKNKIVDVVEKYKGYTDDAKYEIDQYLGSIGYKTTEYGVANCSQTRGEVLTTTGTYYNYCVEEIESDNSGLYYRITTYIYFEFPLLGDLINFPIHGETEVFHNKINIEG